MVARMLRLGTTVFFRYGLTLEPVKATPTITFGDQLLGMFCSSVADAHSGEKAMLICNAFNITTNTVIPGKVSLFNSEISETATGWNAGIPVGADRHPILVVLVNLRPPMMWPKQPRVVQCRQSKPIGLAKISISEPAEVYTYASTHWC
jgi:hypothetical protein